MKLVNQIQIIIPNARRRQWITTFYLYTLSMFREFRWTLYGLASAMCFGMLAYHSHQFDSGYRLSWALSAYHSWMLLLAQPRDSSPPGLLLGLMAMGYPVIGFILVGEGVVRLALLLSSKRAGHKEWFRIMASTFQDHIVLCGLGHLGFRVLQQLLDLKLQVVVLEKHRSSQHLTHAKELGAVVLLRDMKEDQALIDASIKSARAIIICTNDDMANLEVAMDSRRLNPNIRVIMRLFDQQIALKISDAFKIDAAFSSSTLAAPIVAALSLNATTLSSYFIGTVQHVAVEITVEPASRLIGKLISEIEMGYQARVLARTTAAGQLHSPPQPAMIIEPGDQLVVHTPSAQLATISAAAS